MESQMLNLPLRVLKIIGLHPTDNTWIAQVIAVLAIIANVVMIITTIMEIRIVEWNIVSVAPEVEALVGSFQGVIRWFILINYKKEISELMSESKTFWRINDEDPNKETEAESILQWLWKGMRIYLVCIYTAGFTALITPIILTWGEVLPFASWFPRDVRYGYLIFYTIQAVYVPAMVSSMVGTEGLFVALCGQLIAQFKLLSRRLENSTNIENQKDYLTYLQESIRYHIKLLAFGEKIAKVFSGLFFAQYLNTIIATCIELFLLSEERDDLAQYATFITYVSTIMSEMAILCFLSEGVMEESMNVGWAIYSSEWYSKNIKEVGVYVYMINVRASMPVTFTGCGLFVMRRILWFNIIKMSVSVFTLLASLK